METVDAKIEPREVQSQIGDMTLTVGDHELKVVVHVESTKGEAVAQEREVNHRASDANKKVTLSRRSLCTSISL